MGAVPLRVPCAGLAVTVKVRLAEGVSASLPVNVMAFAVFWLVLALCAFAVALFTAGWPPVAVFAVCVLYGATAVGWNGVFLAEVARLAPEGRVAIVTGGTQFFTFAGVLIGPPLFGAIASATGSYGSGFLVIAALPLLAGAGLLASGRGSAGRG